MKIRLAIFDDNPKFLDAVSTFVRDLPEIELVGAFPDTLHLIRRLQQSQPDIVLMDIGIAPVDGIDATRSIGQLFPAVKILIQTVFDEDSKVFAAIGAGAAGYVVKRDLPNTLAVILRELHNGGSPLSPAIASKILRRFREHLPHPASQTHYNLNRREQEILKYLVEGLSYKMIAARCSLSFETIKTYIKRIYEKLEVSSMAEAVAKAIYENLV